MIKTNLPIRTVPLDGEPILEFARGEFRIDFLRYKVYRGDKELTINKQSIKVLILLLLNANELVLSELIKREIWGDPCFISSNSIEVCMHELRKAIGLPNCISTDRGFGYKIYAPVDDDEGVFYQKIVSMHKEAKL